MREPITTYSDAYGRQTELTSDELRWFHDMVDRANNITGNRVPIISFDFDLLTDKDAANALGRTETHNPENPASVESATIILIDTWFIHECYDARFGDGWDFGNTLEETVAHEIAHTHVWDHGPEHSALTERIRKELAA